MNTPTKLIARMRRHGRSVVVALSVWAALAFVPSCLRASDDFNVTVNKAGFVHLSAATTRITVGNPEVADVRLLDPTHLYVLGRRLGNTNVVLCSQASCYRTIEVEVTHDLDGLKAKLHELFPNEHPKVLSSQGAIVLSGQVSSLQKMDAIIKIANTFAPRGEQQPSEYRTGNQTITNIGENAAAGGGRQPGSSSAAPQGQETGVINLMQVGGPQQVMLGVTVAEINRRLARNLKVDFSAVGASGDFSSGTISGNAAVSALTQALAVGASAINPYGMFFRFIGHDVAVKTVINAAKENGLAKILAEPNLTVISGQDADFLSGGEFPVPVPQNIGVGGAGTVTVQFKPFGVMLKFLPVVLDTGRISMKLNIDVSELSADNAVVLPVGNSNESFVIPSLTKRSANSSLELDDGQTLGIAGLISDSMRESISKFPGLGDIPILGQLFTSQKFLKSETELVIFVTPHLVKPVSPDKIALPTDKYVEPSDMEYYLMGRTEARQAPARSGGPGQVYSGGLRGHFGQQP
ncbi:type II and III secretion system protein family protein [Methyloterricola oryzae]|uniref:type II and III secretion system protein family protein n=1 Tax=Methyloterricola oryzae TaxID=1495050 RepID=UPI00069B486D|nr:type II and III secretion system protein family protein [Methyloterricola oryzae]